MTELTTELIITTVGIVLLIGFLLTGIRVVRPTHRAAIETFGKYTGFRTSGITWIVPIVQRMFAVNITEQLIDVEKQEVITEDNLNCNVDAQVYFKVGDNQDSLQKALYAVNNYEQQIVQLARTTLRNVIGTKKFTVVNSQRGTLNKEIFESIGEQTKKWGIEVVRVELKEIVPPNDVQATMNMIIKASNDKQSAVDFATAVETKADGVKRARIKEAEGVKQYAILQAQGEAEAIKTVAEAKAKEIELVNTAASKYFKDQAVTLKQLEVTQASLQGNSKIILTEDGIKPTLVINESNSTIIPTKKGEENANTN